MRQKKGGHVPRDTLMNQNADEYEPLHRQSADEQPELVSGTPTA
jgi:hypothetical protein